MTLSLILREDVLAIESVHLPAFFSNRRSRLEGKTVAKEGGLGSGCDLIQLLKSHRGSPPEIVNSCTLATFKSGIILAVV